MVQDQIVIQKRENDDLLSRNQKLFDQYTRMDIEVNRMSEDLLTSNQFLEQLRNECANLRAEKKIWEVRGTAVPVMTSPHANAVNIPSTNRAFKLGSSRKTRLLRWSARTCPISWLMSRRCTTTSSVLVRTTAGVSKASCSCSRTRRKLSYSPLDKK